MTIKDIKDAIEKKKVKFGIKEALKTKKAKVVFVAKDTRDETIEKLEKAKIKFEVLKPKSEISRELNLDFECEVFSLR